MVQKEFVKKQTTRGAHCNIKNHPVDCKSAKYFEDRAQLAYGFRTLPKLMKELGNDNSLTRWKAMNSLREYIVNPLHAQRAISQFGIVRRCQNVFLRIRKKFHVAGDREIKCLLHIFHYLAMHKNGAKNITNKDRLLDQFYKMVEEREKDFQIICKTLPFLSYEMANRLSLIHDYKVFDKLIQIWSRDICAPKYHDDLWLHLSHILEEDPSEGVKKGFFEILYARINGRLFQYHLWDMKCFGLLLRCPAGQEHFLKADGVKFLYEILNEENLDNYENVIFALMTCLFMTTALWRCREFTNLPLIVTKLAKESGKSNQQLFCLQTLRMLGVMPGIKRFIKANCLDDVKTLVCDTVLNEKERAEIVYWLEREIYHTSDLRKFK